MGKVKVFLADWQVLFREGIHFTLSGEDDIEVIGEATNNEEALTFIETNPPNVAILNADHGKPTGIEVTRRIKQNLPSVSVILVMDSYSDEQLFSVMKSGASACLTKDIDPEDMVNAIREVAQGARLISEALLRPRLAALALDEFEAFAILGEQLNNLLARLSSGEAEILRRIADRNSIEQVSLALGMSEQAIRHQLDLILCKLVANDHNREVIEAAQSNLVLTIIRQGFRTRQPAKLALEYVTKDEFTAFKESVSQRLKLAS
ncbi:MAG: response regulator transcription factor [Dehalococcoidales bacterium]|nr:response regulator transcription factor [Dehalococcoidales bacterium]